MRVVLKPRRSENMSFISNLPHKEDRRFNQRPFAIDFIATALHLKAHIIFLPRAPAPRAGRKIFGDTEVIGVIET